MSAIEWTDVTWNPVTGCDRVSPGCDNCYAEKMATRLAGRYGYPADEPFRLTLQPDRLDAPLRWRKPRRVFVNSMSDLFHPDVPDEFIYRVWNTMAIAEQHTFQVLTKRPQRMNALLNGPHMPGYLSDHTPPPNVWIGVSVENQRYADFRIPHLLETPAAVRFLSVEPMLGPVNLLPYLWGPIPRSAPEARVLGSVDWVIVGGESGRGARPMHPDWARAVRDQCTDAEVAFLFKQWGQWGISGGGWSGWTDDERGELIGFGPVKNGVVSRRTERVDHYCAVSSTEDNRHERLESVGKKAASRELDGRTWDEYPGARGVQVHPNQEEQ